MSTSIRAVVGLGNPGAGYARTRHNAGFWFADALAGKYGETFRPERKFSGDLATLRFGTDTVMLLKPMKFMNRSGLPIQNLVSYYELETRQVLVVHDELDLPAGTVRLKLGGGHGGHNGLRDVHDHIGPDYRRMRIGIGHPGNKDDVLDYVLHKPGADDEKLISDAVDAGVHAFGTLMTGGWDRAVQELHSKEAPPVTPTPTLPPQGGGR